MPKTMRHFCLGQATSTLHCILSGCQPNMSLQTTEAWPSGDDTGQCSLGTTPGAAGAPLVLCRPVARCVAVTLPAFLAASRSMGTLGAGTSGCGTSVPSATSLS